MGTLGNIYSLATIRPSKRGLDKDFLLLMTAMPKSWILVSASKINPLWEICGSCWTDNITLERMEDKREPARSCSRCCAFIKL